MLSSRDVQECHLCLLLPSRALSGVHLGAESRVHQSSTTPPTPLWEVPLQFVKPPFPYRLHKRPVIAARLSCSSDLLFLVTGPWRRRTLTYFSLISLISSISPLSERKYNKKCPRITRNYQVNNTEHPRGRVWINSTGSKQLQTSAITLPQAATHLRH